MENDTFATPDDQRVRDAIKRLQDGVPEDAKNRELVAKSVRLHGQVRINMRMVCRESSLSPTTMYKRHPWVQDAITADEPPVQATTQEPATQSDRDTISQHTDTIAALRRQVGLLQAENHQLGQANIALEERVAGVEQARQAAIDSGRRRKDESVSNVTSIGR